MKKIYITIFINFIQEIEICYTICIKINFVCYNYKNRKTLKRLYIMLNKYN